MVTSQDAEYCHGGYSHALRIDSSSYAGSCFPEATPPIAWEPQQVHLFLMNRQPHSVPSTYLRIKTECFIAAASPSSSRARHCICITMLLKRFALTVSLVIVLPEVLSRSEDPQRQGIWCTCGDVSCQCPSYPAVSVSLTWILSAAYLHPSYLLGLDRLGVFAKGHPDNLLYSIPLYYCIHVALFYRLSPRSRLA